MSSRYDGAGLERVRRRARRWRRPAVSARLRPAYLTSPVRVFQTLGQSADQSYFKYLVFHIFPTRAKSEEKRYLIEGRNGRVASGRVTTRYSRRSRAWYDPEPPARAIAPQFLEPRARTCTWLSVPVQARAHNWSKAVPALVDPPRLAFALLAHRHSPKMGCHSRER